MSENWPECRARGRMWHDGKTAECRAFAHLFRPEDALLMGPGPEPARAPLPLVTPTMCARCDRPELVKALETVKEDLRMSGDSGMWDLCVSTVELIDQALAHFLLPHHLACQTVLLNQ